MSMALAVLRRSLAAIASGGLIAGALDLAYAIGIYSPSKPILVPQTIASGILGARSYQGGVTTAGVGVLLHFLIAFVAAALYWWGSEKAALLLNRPVIAGVAYGASIYVFMHVVVLPLSAVDHADMPAVYRVWEFIEHCFCVGLPIAVSVHHFRALTIASEKEMP